MPTNTRLHTVVTVDWLQQLANRLDGAELTEKPEWGAQILTVGGKQFARYGTDRTGHAILTLKGDPLGNEALRQEFAAVVPGYYANKAHWNSVLLGEATFAEKRLVELVQESYALVFGSLSKRLQAELRG